MSHAFILSFSPLLTSLYSHTFIRLDCTNVPLSILQLDSVKTLHTPDIYIICMCLYSFIYRIVLRRLNNLFWRISSSKPKLQSKWSVHSSSCWPSHLHHMIFKPPWESKSDVWCTRWLWMSRPGVKDVERLDFCGTSMCGSSHMCCSASWACSVYTSSFPTHEPKSKCAFRCELRCLSREKKLNLRGRTEERGNASAASEQRKKTFELQR